MSGNIDPQPKDMLEVEAYLRRICQVITTQSAVDSNNRQRIVIDAITAGLTLSAVTTVSTVSTVSNITALAGQNQRMFEDFARISYSNGIRSNLVFG